MMIASVFFALMNLLVKFVPHIPSYEIVFFRCVITLVISLSYLRKHGIPIFGTNKKYLILRGVFGISALTMYFTSLQNLPLANAVVLQYLSPIFTTIIAIWFLQEKVTPIQWLFFGISFIGVGVIKGFDSGMEPLYFMLGLSAALLSGFAYNCVRKVKDTDHPMVVVFYFPLIGLPVTGLISSFNWVMPVGWDWLTLLGIGVFTQIAQVRMTKALQASKIALVSSVRYLGVIYAIVFGVIFFDEIPSVYTFTGIGLVLTGVLFNIFYKKGIIKFARS